MMGYSLLVKNKLLLSAKIEAYGEAGKGRARLLFGDILVGLVARLSTLRMFAKRPSCSLFGLQTIMSIGL